MRYPKWLCVWVTLLSWGWATPAWPVGLNFVFTYEAGNSNPPTLNGQVDQTGAQLLGIMNSAGALWADIIEDHWTINVAVRWQVPSIGNNFSGQMSLYTAHPNNTNGDPSEQSGRAVWALIRVNPNRTWWVDPTPLNNSEFDMTQTLYRDLTTGAGGQQTGWYTGNVPGVLEVGFRGAPNASAPALMQAAGTRDLLTLALHELGHTVGIGGTQAATNEFGTDGDYDIDTQFVNGANFDALSESTGNSHIHPSSTSGAQVLMCRCGLGGVRILPSAIDVITGATVANWTDIDLQRQDFMGGSDWNTAFNWEGNAIPGSADDAFVRTGANVSLSANGRVENLLISNSSEVTTNANTLTVDNTTTLENNSGGLRPFLRVSAGGLVETTDLNLNGSELLLLGGQVDIGDDLTVRLRNGLRGRITGQGTINIVGDLTNGGVIRPSGGTITINSLAAFDALNLDGIGGVGEIDATVGNLVVNGELLGSFDGEITVGQGRTVTFNDGWELGTNGELNLEGGVGFADAARITGSATTLDGPVNVDGLALINTTTTTIEDGATIDLAANTASGTLEINGQTTYAGGNTVGAGVFKQDGDVVVTGDFSVGNAVYDWDGGGLSDMTINPGASLSISSSTIEPTANDGRDATLNINGGTLSVVTAWRLDGDMTLRETGGQDPTLNGTGGVTVHTTAEFNVIGDATINAPVTVNGDMNIGQFGQTAGIARFNGDTEFASTATVSIEQGSVLWLFGDATYRGGSHTGNGTLRIDGTVDILEDTSWGMLNLDWDGSTGDSVTNIGLGDSLSIASSTIESGANDGYDGTINVNSGQLSVLTAWRLDGEMNMTQIAPQFINPSLSGAGGLTIHTTGQLNTNGNVNINTQVTVNGDIQVTNGITNFNDDAILGTNSSVTLAANANLEFNAATTIEGGDYTIGDNAILEFDAETRVESANFIIPGTGRAQFDAPTTYSFNTDITSTGLIQQNADATVIGTMTVDGGTFDLDGASGNTTINLGNVTNNGSLTLNVDAIDTANNIFNGTIETAQSGLTGRLTVNLTDTNDAWTMAGTLNLHGGNPLFLLTRLAGSRMSVTGEVNLTNRVRITADTDFQANATVNAVGFNAELHVSGNTTIAAGADFNGLMTMVNTASGDLTLNHGANIPFVILRNAGTLSVGNSPGSARVNRYIQTDTGTWEVELGGTTPGAGHDRLTTAGLPAELAGTLALSLLDKYTPNYYDEYVILTAGARIGEFDQITGALIDPDMTLAPVYDYDGNTGVTIVAALPGDANLDGIVNGLDLLAWQSNLFSGDQWVQGDFNLDGMVGGLDLLIWQSHLFNSVPIPSPIALATATDVPEPGVAVLLLSLSGMLMVRRRTSH